MHYKSRTRNSDGSPNMKLMSSMKISKPTVNNMKDQYFILWARSSKVKNWHPINIVSGSEAAKTMKNVGNSAIGKALGGDKLARDQLVKALGMNLYAKREEVETEAKKMHPSLKYAQTIQFGFKEILNNTKFNEAPFDFLFTTNVSLIPPEEELRNLVDDAGEVISEAGSKISEVGDTIKGFFGSR